MVLAVSDSFKKLTQDNASYAAGKCFVGVFVKGVKEVDHVGFVYLSQQEELDAPEPQNGDAGADEFAGETRTLHFLTNEMIEDAPLNPKKKYAHAAMNLHPILAKGFAGFLAAISKINGEKPPILYGLNWAGAKDSFDDKGKYIKPHSIDGLTCATFMSELMNRFFKKNPVEMSTWPEDHTDDLEWRTEVLAKYRKRINLGKSAITEEQVVAMESIKPFIRLRPVQMAAASATDSSSWPMKNYDVTALAVKVTEDFQAAFGVKSSEGGGAV